jgi:hypothetical protein
VGRGGRGATGTLEATNVRSVLPSLPWSITRTRRLAVLPGGASRGRAQPAIASTHTAPAKCSTQSANRDAEIIDLRLDEQSRFGLTVAGQGANTANGCRTYQKNQQQDGANRKVVHGDLMLQV